MATTYTLISSNVLSASAASVTFSAIPSTYTDLVLQTSTRTLNSNAGDLLKVTINSDNINSFYSYTDLSGGGTAGTQSSGRNPNLTFTFLEFINGNTATPNTFSSGEMYFSSYTSASTKPFSSFGVREDNAAGTYMAIMAHQYRGTSGISSLTLNANSGSSLMTGSSFYLYGIKKN